MTDKYEQLMNSTPIYEDSKKIILLTPNMTLLDFFAGQALAGLTVNRNGVVSCSECAAFAYAIASDMLAEREKLLQEAKNDGV